ncbi:MAG: ASKHA domain-containing protein [Syntrophomonadaceae bacterium]|nr:ASKHA domain-containing protein [Syntrophomonadaceae bacterium]MDD3888956.1 ASKHA domain-containing protein [Syntrophomonadaceae bacterium]MDD4548686.1 ASKHA domain-containing protein [Syntrophomonadaceae bacterium]
MSKQVKIKVILESAAKEYYLWSLEGKNLWETLSSSGIDTGGSCGGNGTCGMCKIRVKGEVSLLSDTERELLLPEEIKQGFRLACYCTIKGPLTVYPDYNYMDNNNRNQLDQWLENYRQDGEIHKHTFFIPGIDKYEPVPIYRRIAQALPDYKLELSINNLNELSMLDRAGRPSLELNALVFNNKVVKYVGREEQQAYGVALDVGSTSLFAALVDLQTGQTITVASKANMQRIYGADVISRINYCLENQDGLKTLHQVLINNVNGIIEDLMLETGISSEYIYRVCVVGNPIMLHLFTGLNVNGFGAAPYTGIFLDELLYRAADLDIIANQDASLLILPQIGGFIGADTIACLLPIPETEAAKSYLLIDIGTNGEIVLNSKGNMWAASAAAGPAFEGGNITSGMRAEKGAIDRIFLDEQGNLGYNILGDIPARGICGSAIIDIVACLFKAGYIDENGIITDQGFEQLNIRDSKRGPEIIIVDSQDSLKGTPVVFNQEDIRQVQLAKGAIRTAIDILLKKAGIEYKDLKSIYLAGAFGSYLNPEHCIKIRLLPPVAIDKIKNTGNAAGKGAIIALLSETQQEKARILQQKINYIELASDPDFEKIFLDNLKLA